MESYPWYITDWRESECVAVMTLEERGLYRELLDICWREGSLPNDVKSLRKLSLSEQEEFDRCWPNVSKMFALKYGRLHNKKVDEKRPEVVAAKEARKRGAEAANIKRRAKHDAERSAERDAEPVASDNGERALTVTPRARAFPSPSLLNSPTPLFADAKSAVGESPEKSAAVAYATPNRTPDRNPDPMLDDENATEIGKSPAFAKLAALARPVNGRPPSAPPNGRHLPAATHAPSRPPSESPPDPPAIPRNKRGEPLYPAGHPLVGRVNEKLLAVERKPQ